MLSKSAIERGGVSVSKPTVVREQDVAFEEWSDRPSRNLRWRTLISGDRTPSDSLTMGVAELAPGASEGPRLHRHAQAEIYYILEGQGVVTIDGEVHSVDAGSTVFIPGNAEHGVRNIGSGVMRLLYVFAADSFDQIEYVFPE